MEGGSQALLPNNIDQPFGGSAFVIQKTQLRYGHFAARLTAKARALNFKADGLHVQRRVHELVFARTVSVHRDVAVPT